MFEPLKNNVLVQKQKPKTETDSGILIPQGLPEDPIIEVSVISVGAKADPDVRVGDRAMIGKRDGVTVDPKYCGGLEDCLLIPDNQIRCTIG